MIQNKQSNITRRNKTCNKFLIDQARWDNEDKAFVVFILVVPLTVAWYRTYTTIVGDSMIDSK